MLTDKEKYLKAIKENNGRLDEISIGLGLGFSEENTAKIIDELVNEGKIEFQSFGLCSYRAIQQ